MLKIDQQTSLNIEQTLAKQTKEYGENFDDSLMANGKLELEKNFSVQQNNKGIAANASVSLEAFAATNVSVGELLELQKQREKNGEALFSSEQVNDYVDGLGLDEKTMLKSFVFVSLDVKLDTLSYNTNPTFGELKEKIDAITNPKNANDQKSIKIATNLWNTLIDNLNKDNKEHQYKKIETV